MTTTYFRHIALIVCMLMATALNIVPARAESLAIRTLEISDISADQKSPDVELKWTTNVPVYSTVLYGTDSKKIDQRVTVGGPEKSSFSLYLSGLKGDTTYYFQIEIQRGNEKTTSFVRSFKTAKTLNYTIPEIKNVSLVEFTGKTAVIRWDTPNIDTKGTVRYGTNPEKLTSRVTSGKGKIHEVVLKNLKPATRYYYQVSAEATDKRIHTYVMESFRTVDTDLPDRQNLNINQIRPLTVDENLVGSTDLTIQIQTNRLSSATVSLAPVEKNRGKSQTKKTTGYRETLNSIYFDKLSPNTTYRATISVRDVVGRQLKVSNITFKTKASGTSTPTQPMATGEINYSQHRVVKAADNPTVYILLKDPVYNISKRLAIMNEKAFVDYGLRWSQIETISGAELRSYPLVRLVRTNQSPAVYMIDPERRLKLTIPNEVVFNAYGFSWSEVARVNESDIASYYQTVLVKEPGSATVYMIDGQTKKAFSNENAFIRSGFSFEQVYTIHPQHLLWFQPLAQTI